jgi:protein gp37
MSDLFHESVPVKFICKVWDVMGECAHHTFQILTKRPDRATELTAELPLLQNVWLGTSVESADYLDRLDQLRTARAAIRFVSFEPLLGSVAGADLHGFHWAIVGGESGPRARAMKVEWVEEIEAACKLYGSVFFFKQWGGVNKKRNGRLLRGETFDGMPSAHIS